MPHARDQRLDRVTVAINRMPLRDEPPGLGKEQEEDPMDEGQGIRECGVECGLPATSGHETGEQPRKGFLDASLERAADGTTVTNALLDRLVQRR